MQIFIILIMIIIYLVVIAWTWNNLEDLEKHKKIIIIGIGLLIVFIITNIIFAISKAGINYQNAEIQKDVGNIMIALFTGVNALILPLLFKNILKMKNGEMEETIFKTKMGVGVIVFLLIMCLECGYIKDIQKGILEIYNTNVVEKIGTL